MTRKEYSAGAVKHCFWFQEFRKMINMLMAGNSLDDIKSMNKNQNIFAASTAKRATQIYNTVANRVRNLDSSFHIFFSDGELATQKLINLISIMNTDALFFDFVYEVYREKLILGEEFLPDSDIRVFFKNKQMQDERVAGWQDVTFKRLSSSYKGFMTEAGIVGRGSGQVQIIKPILDNALEKCLIENGMKPHVNALTGV